MLCSVGSLLLCAWWRVLPFETFFGLQVRAVWLFKRYFHYIEYIFSLGLVIVYSGSFVKLLMVNALSHLSEVLVIPCEFYEDLYSLLNFEVIMTSGKYLSLGFFVLSLWQSVWKALLLNNLSVKWILCLLSEYSVNTNTL